MAGFETVRLSTNRVGPTFLICKRLWVPTSFLIKNMGQIACVPGEKKMLLVFFRRPNEEEVGIILLFAPHF